MSIKSNLEKLSQRRIEETMEALVAAYLLLNDNGKLPAWLKLELIELGVPDTILKDTRHIGYTNVKLGCSGDGNFLVLTRITNGQTHGHKVKICDIGPALTIGDITRESLRVLIDNLKLEIKEQK